MSIVRGWHEEETTEEFNNYNELNELSINFLKNKLTEIFELIKNNPFKESMAPKGKNYL